MVKTGEGQRAVVNYYIDTSRDYRILLRHGQGHWGMHYGYKDKDHQSLRDSITNQNKILAKLAGMKADMKVLDVGCGVGSTAIWLAKNIGVQATGVNIVAPHIKIANKHAEEEGVADKTEFYLRDMRDTKLPPASFDVVMSVEAVCYVEDKADFIKEAYRLLKPGGILVLSDGFQKDGKLTSKESRQMRRWLDGWALLNLATINSFTEDLRAAGFKNITHRNTTPNVMDFSRFLYKWGLAGYPASKFFELIRLRTDWETKNVVAAIWQYITLKNGVWSHNMFRAKK